MTGYRTVKPVLRALLGLALFVPSVLAPQPAAAQSLPTVSFAPTTVAPGGTITVNVGGFACNQSVTIELTSQSDFHQITTLGSLIACKDFDKQFSLAGVPVDVYTVRATDQHAVQAFGRTPLTIAARGIGITGTATCKVGGVDVPQPGALVELFSGSSLVGRTTADSKAQYAFPGLGQNATYLVEFTQFVDGPGTLAKTACGAQVTTNSDGFGTTRPPDVCPSPDGNDHGSWDNAFTLTNTVAVPSRICQPGQSFWAKLAINPGSTVFVSLSGGGPKTRVELFRDIRKEADNLLAQLADPALNVRQLTASLPGAGSTGWDSNGWDSNPWDSNGWDSNPWDSNGWDSNPWDSNGWDSNPCPQSACGSVGSKDAPVYSAAEQRALLAFSKHGQITRNTWDNTGDYFVRVFNTDATFDPTQPLSLSVTAGPVCGTGNFAKTTTPPAVVGNPTTLILYDSDRLKANNGLSIKDPSNAAALTSFQSTLSSFAAQPAVTGVPIDLATDANLTNEYTQWDLEPSCVPAANIVSESIHDVIAQYRNQPGSKLRYVTLFGGHTTLPYRLLPDYAEIQQEKRYNPGLLDQSQSAASLGSDYVMTDNYYISFTPVSHLESEINLPEANMGVGRIVETLEDVTSNLQAFNGSGGVLKAKTALASGYTFVQDLANFEATQFSASGLVTETGAKDVAHPQGLLISDSWTMPDLKGKVFAPGGRFDILALNWHAATNVAVAADYDSAHPTLLTTADIEALAPPGDTRFNNALIMSIGCHLGYNLVNPDVIGQAQAMPVTNPRDFVQVLSGKGAMVLGNTGYGYGDTDFIGYSERLLGAVTQELEYNDYGAAVPVGLALTRAKRNYIDGAVTLTGVDKKSVEQLTFYGPPMWSVTLPNRQTRPGVTSLGITPTASSGGLSIGDVSPPYILSERIVHDGTAQFFFADGGTVANNGGAEALPYRAVQPFKGFDATPLIPAGTARGVAMLSADYQDIANYRPLINLPATEEAGFARVPTSGGFTPIMPFGLNELLGQTLAVTPFQWTTPDAGGSVARKYLNSGLHLRTYYSSSLGATAVAGPATIGNVAVTSNGSLVHVEATIRGANVAGISDVLLTYTAVGTNDLHNDSSGIGKWVSCNLVSGQPAPPTTCLNAHLFSPQTNSSQTFERHYSGDIETAGTGAAPTDLRVLIQAVTGTGLVSVAANNGRYYQVVQAPTISTPKHATSLTLTPPSTPSPYDHSATFTASLRDLNTLKPTDGQVIFTVGSQQVVVQTVNGTATTTFTILGLPGPYQVKVAFAETPTLLGSTASADYAVVKKATSLAFSPTSPFIVTLTDADGHLLRDEAVFFNVSNGVISQTISAQTGRDGVAQLRGLTVPAGSYTVTAYFLGDIPFDTGKVARVIDDRYSASTASTTLQADTTGPTCVISAVGTDPATGRRFIKVTIQDRPSGLASVSATRLLNADLLVPDFTVGTQAALTVTALRKVSTLATVVSLEVVDVAGNVTNCDPALLEVGGRGEARTATASDILPTERYLTVYNGRPGINRLEVLVNKRTFEINGLKAGQVRTIDIAKGLRQGKNVVTVKVEGNPNGSALVLISNAAPTPAQTRRNPNDPQGGNNNTNDSARGDNVGGDGNDGDNNP